MKSVKRFKKSVVFFLPRYHTNLVGITEYFLKKKIDIKILSTEKKKIENYLFSKPILIPKININIFFFKFYFLNLFKIKKLLKKNKFDLAIIRLHNFHFDIFLPIFLKFFTDVKFVFYSQVDINYYLKLNLLKRIKYFFFLNFFNSKIVTPVFNINRIKINKYFIPFPFLLKMKKQVILRTKYIKILTIGKFQERKNLLLLIKVLEKIKINYKLIIIGEKSDNAHNFTFMNIKNYIGKKKLDKKIDIKFNIDHNKINKFYNWCDFFVLPSTKEPASISPLEALSFRKAVICSDNNGIRYYIKDGVNGYIFRDNNFKSLKKKIIKMFLSYKKINLKLKVHKSIFLNENLLKKISKKQSEFKYDF